MNAREAVVTKRDEQRSITPAGETGWHIWYSD